MHKYVTYILIAFAVVGVIGVAAAALGNVTNGTPAGNTAAYANCPHMNGVQNQNENGNAVCPMQNANSAAGSHACGMTNGGDMMGGSGGGMMGSGRMGSGMMRGGMMGGF